MGPWGWGAKSIAEYSRDAVLGKEQVKMQYYVSDKILKFIASMEKISTNNQYITNWHKKHTGTFIINFT